MWRFGLVALALWSIGCTESESRRLAREAQNRPPDAGVEALPYPPEATLLATGQNVPRNLQADATHLYWLNEGRRAEGQAGVFRVSKQGGEAQTLFEGKGVDTIAVDDAHVYFIVPEREVVYRVPKSGGEPEAYAPEQEGLSALVLDQDYAYWSGGEGLVRMPKAGGKPQVVVTGLAPPVGLGVDGQNLYWYSAITGDLMKAPKKGGKPKPFHSEELTLHSFFVDQGDLYWTFGSDKKAEIRRAAAAGKPAKVVGGQSIPIELATDDRYVYWTTGDQVVRAPKDGGEAQVVVAKTDRSIGVAVDGAAVYWTDRAGRIQKVKKP
jgi:hypothetical protein